MLSADLQVIKDIPGYKVILKAVLRSQIQQLVQQLETDIGEDFVLLTTSVSEGSLSHLGSESGRDFLEDHDDIKAKFLAFCLKRHHTLKQREKEQHTEHVSEPENREPVPRQKPLKPHVSPGLGPAPLSQTTCTNSPPPASMTSKQQSNKQRLNISRSWTSRVRHEPYPTAHTRQTANNLNSSSHLKENIKIEVNDNVDEEDGADKSNTETEVNRIGNGKTKFIIHSNSDSLNKNENTGSLLRNISSESSEATLIDETVQIETARMDKSVNENNQGTETMTIKEETNSEYDLGISGVEPGSISQNTSFNPVNTDIPTNIQKNLNDMEQKLRKAVTENILPDNPPIYVGYTGDRPKKRGRPPGPSKGSFPVTQGQGTKFRYACTACGKRFTRPSHVEIHQRIHTGDRPYQCKLCDYTCAQQGNLKYHMRTHIEQKPVVQN